jgi:DNA-binding MarR family transcriptional regulator
MTTIETSSSSSSPPEQQQDDNEKWLNEQFSQNLHARTTLSKTEVEDYIKALYDKHGTVRKAAREINVSPSTIVRHLHGWEKRRRGLLERKED